MTERSNISRTNLLLSIATHLPDARSDFDVARFNEDLASAAALQAFRNDIRIGEILTFAVCRQYC